MRSYAPRIPALKQRICGNCIHWNCISSTCGNAFDPYAANPLGSCMLVTTANVCLKAFKSPACSLYETLAAVSFGKAFKKEETE